MVMTMFMFCMLFALIMLYTVYWRIVTLLQLLSSRVECIDEERRIIIQLFRR